MTTFQRPCSGFTASDLISLQAIWPEGTHESGTDGDRFLVRQPGQRIPWLSIARHRDGTYLSLDLSGQVYARGRSLADLALDGDVDRPAPIGFRDAGRSDRRGGR
jgi:hypothetical protein